MSRSPRILIFTGDGKGKTTAALGLAFRASGHGLRVGVIQFVKGDSSVGEMAAAAQAENIEIVQTGLGFLPSSDDPRFCQHREAAREGLHRASDAISERRFSVLILDEICLAVARGLVSERQVQELVSQVTPEQCIVMTGRGATPGLIALADTVTEMRCLKHGFQLGFEAQEGVER